MLEYVPDKHKTLELCRIAISNSGEALMYVREKNRTLELCDLAVKNSASAIVHVSKNLQTINMYINVMLKDDLFFSYSKNISEDILKKFLLEV